MKFDPNPMTGTRVVALLFSTAVLLFATVVFVAAIARAVALVF